MPPVPTYGCEEGSRKWGSVLRPWLLLRASCPFWVMGSVDLRLPKVGGESKMGSRPWGWRWVHPPLRRWLRTAVFSHAFSQYREEVIAEGSRSILLENAVMLMGSYLSVMLGWDTVGIVFFGAAVVIGSKNVLLWEKYESAARRLLSRGVGLRLGLNDKRL